MCEHVTLPCQALPVSIPKRKSWSIRHFDIRHEHAHDQLLGAHGPSTTFDIVPAHDAIGCHAQHGLHKRIALRPVGEDKHRCWVSVKMRKELNYVHVCIQRVSRTPRARAGGDCRSNVLTCVISGRLSRIICGKSAANPCTAANAVPFTNVSTVFLCVQRRRLHPSCDHNAL